MDCALEGVKREHKTTGWTVATNSVTLSGVPAGKFLGERVMFDLEELNGPESRTRRIQTCARSSSGL